MSTIFSNLKRFAPDSTSKSWKSTILNSVFNGLTLKPIALTRCTRVQPPKRSGCWKGAQYDVEYAAEAEEVQGGGLRRAFFWRGCRYDIEVQSLDCIKATVLRD